MREFCYRELSQRPTTEFQRPTKEESAPLPLKHPKVETFLEEKHASLIDLKYALALAAHQAL